MSILELFRSHGTPKPPPADASPKLIHLDSFRRTQADAREALMAKAIVWIGRGKPVWVNYWRHYRNDKPEGLSAQVCESREEAASDCSAPVWESPDGRAGMLYLGTICHHVDGRTTTCNLAQPVRPSDGDAA